MLTVIGGSGSLYQVFQITKSGMQADIETFRTASDAIAWAGKTGLCKELQIGSLTVSVPDALRLHIWLRCSDVQQLADAEKCSERKAVCLAKRLEKSGIICVDWVAPKYRSDIRLSPSLISEIERDA